MIKARDVINNDFELKQLHQKYKDNNAYFYDFIKELQRKMLIANRIHNNKLYIGGN